MSGASGKRGAKLRPPATDDDSLIRIGRLMQGAVLAAHMRVQSVDKYIKTYGEDSDPATLEAKRSWGRLGIVLIQNGIAQTGRLIGPEDSLYAYGRNLHAAVWAAARGYSSVDNAIKRHVPERIDSAWAECAWQSFNSALEDSPLMQFLKAVATPTKTESKVLLN